MFKLKGFQVEDYARAALTDGVILAHDTGLGKGIAAVIWPLLKCGVDWPTSNERRGLYPSGKVLIIAPQQLHGQLLDEWKNLFGVRKVTLLESQEQYEKLKPLSNGWYLSSFTQIASNKIAEIPDPAKIKHGDFSGIASVMQFYGVSMEDARKAQFDEELVGIALTPFEKIHKLLTKRHEEFSTGVGEEHSGFRCIYSPSLADLCRNDFDCVVIDEATRIKGEETLVGVGCRLMRPKFRLVLTATPIKNRLPDIFWLTWWAAGGNKDACARFPYSQDKGQQDLFGSEFLVTERNLDKEKAAAFEKTGKRVDSKSLIKKKKRGTLTADVCNIHRLWKLLAPNIIRRRKADIGEYLVPKTKHPIIVPMGEAQAETYGYHLAANYVDRNGDPAILAKLQALRSAAAGPNSSLLLPIDGTILLDEDKRPIPNPDQFCRSAKDYTPRMAAALSVIEQCMARGEQVVVFSALQEALDTLSARLHAARVPHDLLDGRKSPTARGAMAAQFKKGLPKGKPVLLAGIKAMGEGNSWHLCNNVILLCFDWAYDLFEQGINRIHRLNSTKPVNVYPIICEGTIDRRLDSLIEEKGDAAELVLDGELLGENIEAVNLGALLKLAGAEFANVKTYSESLLEREWGALRDSMERAYFQNILGIKVEKPKSDTVDIDIIVESSDVDILTPPSIEGQVVLDTALATSRRASVWADFGW